MTVQTKHFVDDLLKLCALHGVEICPGSRFWVFGKERNQIEKIGVSEHLEASLHPDECRNIREKLGAQTILEVTDLSKESLELSLASRRMTRDWDRVGSKTTLKL